MSRFFLVSVILLSVALNSSAQILLRWGARTPISGSGVLDIVQFALRPGILAGLACYGISVVVWVYVLGRVEVSFAYPFLGLGFVLVSLTSWFLLGEPLSPQRVAGTFLVTIGVFVLATS